MTALCGARGDWAVDWSAAVARVLKRHARVESRSFLPLATKLHNIGLKFGVWTMRGTGLFLCMAEVCTLGSSFLSAAVWLEVSI